MIEIYIQRLLDFARNDMIARQDKKFCNRSPTGMVISFKGAKGAL